MGTSPCKSGQGSGTSIIHDEVSLHSSSVSAGEMSSSSDSRSHYIIPLQVQDLLIYIYMWVIKGPVFGLRTCRDVIGFPHLMHHLQGRTSPFPHSCHPGIGAKRIFEKMEPQTSNGLQPTSDGLYGSKTIQNHEPPKRTTSPKCRTSRQRCLLSKDLLQLQQPL